MEFNALMTASQNEYDKVVDILIKAGADINYVKQDGYETFMITSEYEHEKLVALLNKAGADILHVENNIQNALIIASQNGDDKLVNILIKSGADINFVKQDGYNALMIASLYGHDKVIDILIEAGADINHVEDDGFNALMIASRNGHDNVVDHLIKAGADIHHVNDKLWNALMFASHYGNDKVVEILIKAGSDIHELQQNKYNALMIASQNGHDKVVDILIKAGADINHVEDDGWNALLEASQNGHDKVVEILIKAGADINYVKQNDYNALMVASQNGHDKVVDFLIKAGADVNHVKDDGWNALMIASYNGHDKVVDILIKAGTDINHVEYVGKNALMISSLIGHDKVVDILIKARADIHHVEENGWNALMLASQNGHDKVVDILIKAGADINFVKENGWNALLIASQNGHEKVVDILIKAGADIHHVKENGWNALMIASQSGHEKVVDILINAGADINHVEDATRNALMIASLNGHDKVVDILIKAGADINHVGDNGWNALLIALQEEHDKVVDILIKCGADINHLKDNGWNALMIASQNGHDKVVDILIEAGADINHLKDNGWNALMIASQNGHNKVVDILIKCGADIHIVEEDGYNALMIASKKGHEKVVDILIKAGADISHVKQNGNNALLIASNHGHDKVVDSLINEGADIIYVNEIAQDSSFLGDRKNDNKDCLNTFSFRTTLLLELIDVCFLAFENKQKHVIDTLSSMNFKIIGKTTSTTMFHFLISLFEKALKQDLQNVTKNELRDATVSEQNDAEVRHVKRSIDCYIKTVLLSHNNQRTNYYELKEFVSDVMSEFLNMRDFDALHFFMCQRCLRTIYSILNAEDNLKFFTLLLDLNYADITSRCLNYENLLDTRAPGFSTSLIRDMLSLLISGSHHSTEFGLRLAEKDVVKTFTDCLTLYKDVQNSQSKWIISQVVTILYNIARRKGAKIFFSMNNTYSVIQNMDFKEKAVAMDAALLLLNIQEDSPIDTGAFKNLKHRLKETLIRDVVRNEEDLGGYSRSELLQGLAKFLEQNEDVLNEVLPLFPHLKEILTHNDPDEQIFTTQCLRELSRNKEGSEKIITDEELNDMLIELINSHNGDLSANVHSVLWRAGRTTGILPSKTDVVLSDEFPKKFEIKPASLGQGGFGSVHLVVDIDQPEDEKFVAKKTHADPNNQKKWMESLQSEASILIKLKHKNIVKFHGFQRKENDIILFLEYIKMGTLSTFIKQHTRLNEGLTRQFTIQILEGVKYLHENNILHLDIKGTNILMVDESNIKLTDFGLSTILNEEGVEAERGTTRYMAPEMINCPDGRIFKHCCSLDIWSVGSTVVEMITGSPPNSTTTSVRVLFKIAMLQRPKYELSMTASKNLRDFLEKTFTPEAGQRPSAEDLLREDPFITGGL
ncbi:uncharacterized protein LOC131958613 isoform X2 [Physella acuta]|uniref:uncharacterized protein LOC131958613 isoform X2 n=1 Tax=Physella acuta TaxID=109671 RepID=UPI0027DE62A5|nr:uncharacterized protein LOC131958613 isoform X2 [Physella acuta]